VGRPLALAVLLLAFLASICLPSAARATLAFDTNPSVPEVWVSGNDDGTEATYVGHGLVAQVSPDGRLLAYEHEAAFSGWELIVYDVATGKRSVRLVHMDTIGESVVGEMTAFAWSPDSTMVAAVQNERRTGRQSLYVIPVSGGGGKTRIATGRFRGVSFSPDGKEVVFGLAHSRRRPIESDIARAPVTGGPITLLTHDHVSGWPLWGPRGQIAFSRRSKAKRWRWRGETSASELFDLFVMKANGGRVKRMTRVGAYEAGFFPAFWLPSGERLVANFQSLEKNYAALVDPGSDTVTALNPPLSGQGLAGFKVGFAALNLTADEGTVLGCQGSVVDAIQPPASVLLTGGRPTVLDKDAYSPSWSGLPSAGASPC
jgi:Tol biopolymer transport system component